MWNRDLSVAFLGDIAILEVAMRNAMHDAATAAWGAMWFADQQVRLDDRSLGNSQGRGAVCPTRSKEIQTAMMPLVDS